MFWNSRVRLKKMEIINMSVSTSKEKYSNIILFIIHYIIIYNYLVRFFSFTVSEKFSGTDVIMGIEKGVAICKKYVKRNKRGNGLLSKVINNFLIHREKNRTVIVG